MAGLRPRCPQRQDVGHHGLPKDDERRLIQIGKASCRQLREHMVEYGVPDTDLLDSA